MKPKTHKLLSVLLSLVMLLSLAGPLAPSARAEGPYKVGIDDIFNGSVTADKDMADEGETVRLTVTPSPGYIIESISVYAIDLHSAVPTTYSEGNYVFTMPASEVQASATFRPAAPSTTEIPSVGLALTLPSTGGSYSGAVPAAVSISSGTGFTVKSANWFNGGTPETNPGCGLAPTSFEAGKPYFAEICLAPAEGYAFADGTAVTIDTLGVKSKAVIDDEADRMGWLYIVTDDYTMPAAPYTITVNGGKAYKAGGVEIASAAEGDSVYILFDDDAAPAGKYIEWGSAVTEPAVSISAGMISGTEYQAGFIMPAADITVSPDYLDQKSLTVDLTGGTSTDTYAASNAVWSLYRAEDLGLITADISDSHQEKFDLDKDGSWDVTYSTNDSEFSVQDSCSVTGDKTLTIPAAEYSPVTFKFKAAAVPYTVDLSTGKMDLATGQEFADLFNSLGAWTHMSSTSGSSTYYYDLDKDGTEDISVTNSSSSRNVLLLTTSNITTDTYVISDSTGPYNPITFILKAPTVTTYPVWVGGVHVTSANKDDILGDGGKAKYDPDTNTLTLDNPTISEVYHGAAVYAEVDLTITGSATLSKAILVNYEKDLTLDANIVIATPGRDCAIIAGNITVNGGSISASADEDALIATSSITINAGSVVGNGCDLYAGSITIAGGTVNVSDGLFGIYSKNDITISGGTVTAKGNDYGIYAGGSVTISGGSVTAKATGSDSVRYGINGNTVSITGGTVTATSTQYAIGGTDISISGGTVTATGDRYGISQSHEFSITGGTLEATGIEVRAFDFSSITVGEGLDVLVNTEASASGATAWNGTDPLGGQNTVIFKYVKIEPGAEKYPVWVGGVQVTSANKDDILGDGKASFDPDTNTLTLNSPTVSTSYKGALIYAEGIDLNITGKATLKNENTAYGVLVKDGSLNSDANLTVEVRQYGVSATKSININGGSVNSKTTGHGSDGVGYALGGSDIKISSGTVTATSAQGPAISTTNSVEISGGTVNVTGGYHGISTKSLAISGGTVTVEGDWNGIKAEENITISGGTVAAKSNKSSYKGIYAGGTIEIKNGTACVTADGNSGAIEGSKITLGDGLMIQEPTGGKLSADGQVIKNADDIDATHAVIVPGTVTPLPKVVGIKVNVTGTQENAGAYDVTTDTLETSFESSTAPVTMSTSFLYTAQACQAEDKLTTAPVAGTPYYFVISIDAYTDGETPTLEWADNDTIKSGSTMTADNGTVEIVEFFHSPAGGSLSVICKYTETAPAATHTVTFEANGGTPVPEAQTVADGGKATKPADPTKSGVSFGGWYTDEFFTEVFDFNTPITANITLYASWNQYIYMLQIKKVWEDDDDAAGKRPNSVDVKVLGNGTEIGTVTLTKDEGWKKLYVMATGEADLVLTCEEIMPEGYTLKDMTKDGDTIILTNQYDVTPPAPTITYSVASGGNSTWTKGSGSGVTIVVKRDPNDAECFSHFASVQIDGATLKNGTDYSAVSGSTVVTFPAATLQGLSDGKHAVTLSFDDGKAVTDLTILAGSTNAGSLVSPRTGDESQPILWIAVLLLSGLGLGGLAVAGRKRRQAGRR